MPPSITPDPYATRETLFLRLRKDGPGCEIAWREFHDRYSPIIAAFARKMGVKDQDASDVIQDVLLGFFSASPKFVYDPSKGRFRGYLKTCTWRIMRDRSGQHLNFHGRCLSDVDPNDLGVDQVWNDVWETEKLERALDIVRERYLSHSERSKTFQAFEMYVLLERPAEAVAAELAISVDSVHQAKGRISKALKSAMDEIGD